MPRRIDPEDVAPRIPGPPRAVPVREVERPLSGGYPTNIGKETTGILPPVQTFQPVDADANTTAIAEAVYEALQTDNSSCSQGESLILTLGYDVTANDVAEDVFVVPQLRARVTFGNGSIMKTIDVDWINGTQLAFGAKQLLVQAVYRLTRLATSSNTLAAPPEFKIQTMTSYGTLNQNSHGARLTEIVAFEADPGVQTLRVPDFATSFTIVPFAQGTWTASLYSWGSAASVDYAGGGAPLDATTYNVENAFPHFNGARFLDVASEDTEFIGAVIFDLAF